MGDFKLEQNSVNKRSQRKCADYERLEAEYQEAQEHWELYQDQESWNRMWLGIQLAVFNAANKKLEGLLPQEEITERSTDITCNIIRSLLKKKKNGKKWKIDKLSSFAYLPCLALYSPALKHYDKLLTEDKYTKTDSTGRTAVLEYSDSYIEDGIYHIHRSGENITPEKDENPGMNYIQAFDVMINKYGYSEDEIKAVIGLVEDFGMLEEEKFTERQLNIIKTLVRLLEGDAV